MKITEIEHNKKHSIVSFENDRKFIIDNSIIKKHSIEEDSHVNMSEILDENEDYAYEYALNYSFKLLGISAKTKKEMKTKLYDKYIQTNAVNKVIERLEELGFVNDVSYAEDFVEYKKESGYSKRGIISKLKEKGVDEDIINSAMESYSDEDEFKFALYFALKIAEQNDAMEYEKLKNKIYSRLASKGFTNSAIYSALNEVKERYNDSFSNKEILTKSAAKMFMRGMNEEEIFNTLMKKSNSKEYEEVVNEVLRELFS